MSTVQTVGERPNQTATSDDFELAALELSENYRAAMLREFGPHLRGRVLEVGAGLGRISERLVQLPQVDELTAIEPGAALAARFRARLPDVRLIEGTVADFDRTRAQDAIVSINVLEHIRDDEAELAAYRSLLAPRGGHLCLFVPARPEIYAPIDRDFGHHRRYRRSMLRGKLLRAGFQIERLSYFNSVGYLAWWLNFRVLEKRTFEPAAVKLFDRVIFPVVHALETRVARPPIGQSLIAVARA